MGVDISREAGNSSQRPRTVPFYALTVFLSLLFAVAVIEMVLRNSDYITSTNMMRNAAVERWMAKHWRVNELGYRDILLAPRLASPRPKIYFLGDSFTAGHGIDFRDTYYFRIGSRLEDDFNLFNISQPGLSTLGEHKELSRFNDAIHSRPDIAIHQYFINDIEDYIPRPSWKSPAWLALLSRHLETAQLLETLLFDLERGRMYRQSLLAAYRNPALLEKHRKDVTALHQHIRDDGGTVIFVAFPALNDKYLPETSFIIDAMRDLFARTCQSDDIFIDATPAALSLKEPERVVSILDDHPSPALHSLIANQIIKAIRRESAEGGPYKAYETCGRLQATQARAHRGDAQP